jgi:REP element-mobilizing transposase RayT
MTDSPRRRNSLRYHGYNYATPGVVFVTFCTHNRQHLFGTVHDSNMHLNQYGLMLAERWQAIPQRFSGVEIDDFIIMPDHMHAILWSGTLEEHARGTCSDVVQWVKIAVQRDISLAVKTGCPRYVDKLWQRGFYDRVVRDERELEAIRFYSNSNPQRWETR